ncbi:Fur family transcriptional regulator [Streptosporangium sp. NPDC050855]|uniref:Fur family transcriptional regulator n=1 Tax=Streptosporangium sp. NPDC050855 TaxID=3366194 RepID=UPI0037A31F77
MDHRDARELRSRGVTATGSRLLVLRCLRAQPEPKSAGEIHVQLRSRGDRVGLTTVYRTLAALVRADLVHAFERNGETAYRICDEGEHCHVVCRACGAVTEVAASALEPALSEGFRIEEIYGTCPGCRQR